MTEQGKLRKARIVNKLFFKQKKTLLHIHLYNTVLPLLKDYVMVFQGQNTLVHKLHEKQVETFTTFLACFVKAEYLQELSPSKLQSLNVSDPCKLLRKTEMFCGEEGRKMVKKGINEKDSVVLEFITCVKDAYITTAQYMQKKLPLNSATLKALSALDPMIRGHSVAVREMENLAGILGHVLPKDASVQLEIRKYSVDSVLAQENQEDIVKFWSCTRIKEKYPGLQKMAQAALSIFHGPMVESSFNVMSDIIGPKSGNLKVETYSSYQTVKYSLRNTGETAVSRFRRDDVKYGNIDKKLCYDLRRSGQRYKEAKTKIFEEKEKRRKEYGLEKAGSAAKARDEAEKSVREEMRQHNLKQTNKARKRALECLVQARAKKAKTTWSKDFK